MICNHFHILRFLPFSSLFLLLSLCPLRRLAQKPQYTKAKSVENPFWLDRKCLLFNTLCASALPKLRTGTGSRSSSTHSHSHRAGNSWQIRLGRALHFICVHYHRRKVGANERPSKIINRKQEKKPFISIPILFSILLSFSIFGIGSEMKFTFRLCHIYVYTNTYSWRWLWLWLRTSTLATRSKKI